MNDLQRKYAALEELCPRCEHSFYSLSRKEEVICAHKVLFRKFFDVDRYIIGYGLHYGTIAIKNCNGKYFKEKK